MISQIHLHMPTIWQPDSSLDSSTLGMMLVRPNHVKVQLSPKYPIYGHFPFLD
jgi:hypothetical protein